MVLQDLHLTSVLEKLIVTFKSNNINRETMLRINNKITIMEPNDSCMPHAPSQHSKLNSDSDKTKIKCALICINHYQKTSQNVSIQSYSAPLVNATFALS